VAGSKDSVLGRPSQWAKLPYTPKAQEGERQQKICIGVVWEPSPGVPGRSCEFKSWKSEDSSNFDGRPMGRPYRLPQKDSSIHAANRIGVRGENTSIQKICLHGFFGYAGSFLLL